VCVSTIEAVAESTVYIEKDMLVTESPSADIDRTQTFAHHAVWLERLLLSAHLTITLAVVHQAPPPTAAALCKQTNRFQPHFSLAQSGHARVMWVNTKYVALFYVITNILQVEPHGAGGQASIELRSSPSSW
jgi:hypothetical protein